MRLTSLLLAGLLISLTAGARSRSSRLEVLEVPLRVRVATCRKRPVRARAWVKAHLDAAGKVLAPHGVRLKPRIEPFTPSKCVLLGRSDRDALAVDAVADQVTVLVVGRVQDLDLPSYNLMGVHWRYGGSDAAHQKKRWVFLTSRARPPVLAHELCHFFGLRHDPAGGNLMAPGPSAPVWRSKGPKPRRFKPLLTARQARRLRRGIRNWLRGTTGLGAKEQTTDPRRR
jgi:hypothetical protein